MNCHAFEGCKVQTFKWVDMRSLGTLTILAVFSLLNRAERCMLLDLAGLFDRETIVHKYRRNHVCSWLPELHEKYDPCYQWGVYI